MMSSSAQSPEAGTSRRFLRPFRGEALSPPPIWLMRQAGRYLPEYQSVRKSAGSFLDLCYSPKLAAEVTLQPIRRYGFDAAILFSDILVVPDALGQNLRFIEGEGPRLDPIGSAMGLNALDPSRAKAKFSLVCETVDRVRKDLPDETALIGFCGAPWTVATYMIEGQGSKEQAGARAFAYRDPEAMARLMDILVEASIEYLDGQVSAGADVLQIFDSWAGSLADDQFETLVVRPTRRIVAALKARHPSVPIIGFPRGAGPNIVHYPLETGVDGLSCDTAIPLQFARHALSGEGIVIQGNLDPLLLVSGGESLDRKVRAIIETMDGAPFIFNLGHGIVPQTPPENVEHLVALVRG